MTTNIRNFFSAPAITGIAALATISFLTSATPAFAGAEPGYSHDSSPTYFQTYWMSNLPDSLKLSYMSIPGTHDSMAQIGGDSVQTQSMDLNMQLYAGIRVVDIRILFQFNQFSLSHGIIPQPGNFDSVMQTVSEFLNNFPRETVLMRVREEMNGLGNTISFEDAFKIYWTRYSHVFWQNPNHETNPTLGEMRGKVVVLRNFTANGSYGLDYGSFHAQDNYNLNTNWDLYNKWTEVKNQLEQANAVGTYCAINICVTADPGNKNIQMINYLSGATGVFPYFVASGKSSPGTSAPRLATGETTPGWNNWPDFPRVDCVFGICTIAFEGTNNLTYNWLTASQKLRVGIIMADFPGYGLIQKVIEVNQEAVAGFR
jgi:1-phosphatidylinositol phosphodiesterase